MIARGLMGTPVIGNQVFHGARVSDIHQVTKIIKQQLLEGHLVVGVGYSMGGIIIANYVARYGESCQFDAAVAVEELQQNLREGSDNEEGEGDANDKDMRIGKLRG